MENPIDIKVPIDVLIDELLNGNIKLIELTEEQLNSIPNSIIIKLKDA